MTSERPEIFGIPIGSVSATLLLTLYSRALESLSDDPILSDPKAVELMEKLTPELAKADSRLYRQVSERKLSHDLVVHIALRAKKYDEYARNFLESSPGGTVVNIGCGLDTRFWRIDDDRVRFYDLDLPDVIALKSKLCAESERYTMLPSSVLDFNWMDRVTDESVGPFIFLAEGVFMYLPKKDVQALVLELQKRFPGSELVCEVFNQAWLRRPWKALLDIKLQREFHLGSDVTFQFGISDGRELERWAPCIEFIDEWSYFDSESKKLGLLLRLMSRIEFIRMTQWTVHYRLH